MRLTLRTLLAYLDGLLEPEDSQDIRKRLDESDYATSLVHRTRDCMRRLRLGAPALTGKGLALDPNTVAEYLDNELASERVPEFEKVCLESDVHLAEVAACHQVLTLVLGEPAEIEPDSRERMYRIISQADAATLPPHARAAAGERQPEGSIDIRTGGRAQPQVPDYLREPGSNRLVLAAVIVIAIGLISWGVVELAPGVKDRLTAWLGPKPDQRDTGADDTHKPNTNGTGGLDQDDTADDTDNEHDAGNARDAGHAGANEPDNSVEPGDVVDDDDAMNDDGHQAEEPGDAGDQDDNPGDADASKVASNTDSNTELANPEIDGPGDRNPTDSGTGAIAPAPPEDDPRMALGRYLSDQDVLLKSDPEAGWRRLPIKSGLSAGDRILTLPLFRSTITLSTGITLQPTGPTLLEIGKLDDQGVPEISIEYGRLLLLTVGKPGNRLNVRIGDRRGAIVFGQPDSQLAIEVKRILVNGQDPESQPAPLAAELYVPSGQIGWEEEDGPLLLPTHERKPLTPLPAFDSPENEPKWLRSDAANAIDQRAMAALAHELSVDRPTALSLKELATSKRAEVRTLAIRSSSHIGQFEPFVTALGDADQRSAWKDHVESLRAAMARSPKVAAQVRAAFEKLRGNDGRELYRMLWGYTEAQLKNGDAARLVEYLNHDSLDYRVLSFWNLQTITGATLYYRPEYPTAKRRPMYLRWKDRLKEGKIMPTSSALRVPKGLTHGTLSLNWLFDPAAS